MPPARSASATHRRPRQTRSAQRPRRLVSEGAKRVRWDRLGRVGLLIVLVVVAGVYVQDALSYLAARSQADQQAAIVQKLTRQNARLSSEQKALNNPATIVSQARALGMVRNGERPYVITGLPNH